MDYSLLIYLVTAALACLTTAAPTSLKPVNFFLVTTSQPTPTANSSDLANVNATSLFNPSLDPTVQEPYLLRLIEPGYNSLPTFNLTNGTLHTDTTALGSAGFGTYEYNSTEVLKGGELQFLPSNQRRGNLGFRDGYLLTVGGDYEGWTVCDGALGEEVVSTPVHVETMMVGAAN